MYTLIRSNPISTIISNQFKNVSFGIASCPGKVPGKLNKISLKYYELLR